MATVADSAPGVIAAAENRLQVGVVPRQRDRLQRTVKHSPRVCRVAAAST